MTQVHLIYDDGYIPPNKFTRVRGIHYVITASGCWECTNLMRDSAGYTVIRRGGNAPQRLHRYVFQLENGSLSSEQVVMHMCDNPRCFNTNHLKIGSHADNVRDKVTKNRHSFGESNGSTKLCEKDVLAIRNDVRKHTVIAKEYGVNRATIGQIKRNETWTHLL